MLDFIDNLLNRITMYRLVLYYLLALVGVAVIFGAVGILPYNPVSILISAAILFVACIAANQLFARLFRASTNAESAYITALILALIISPMKLWPFDWSGLAFLLWASLFAMASKYILAIRRKHIFNPAAVAVAATAIIFGQYASWWVAGNLPLLAFVVIGGLLVVRKIQRFDLVLAFAVAALASCIFTNQGFSPLAIAEKALFHTSLLFVAFVMITEPATTPPTRPLRIAYGLLVGALFSPVVYFGPIYSTPELALIAGNIFSFAVSPKQKYALTFKSKTKIADDAYDFSFTNGPAGRAKKINFQPGQYMEFTLPAPKKFSFWGTGDTRGNRRYFTIASSPAEPELHLGIKFPAGAGDKGSTSGDRGPSTFKQELLTLQPGDRMMASAPLGDFTLPRDPDKKLAFIAGGIGITPFRSMVKTAGGSRDIVLLYSNRAASEIAYRNVFDEAARAGKLKPIYINTSADGRIDADFIRRKMPDWSERIFYLSGPRGMVTAFEETLRELGVARAHIKTDFFPGFA